MQAAWSLAILVVALGCSVKKPVFECADFEDCGPGGACEPNTGACSYPDDSCTVSGRRFSELSVPEYAGKCVELSSPAGKAELCASDAACSGFRKCIGGRCASVSSLTAFENLTCAQCARTDINNDPPLCWGKSEYFERLDFDLFNFNLCTGTCFDCASCSPCAQHCLGSLGADRISVGLDYVCYSAPELFCGGANDHGQLGGDPTGMRLPPIVRRNEGLLYDLIAAGARHTCGRVPTFGVVQCFGDNREKQVTDEDVASSPPAMLMLFGGANDRGIRYLGLNEHATCGATASEVACRGNPRWPAGRIEGLPASGMITSLAVGPEHACVVKNGRLFCWGGNESGQAAPGREALDVGPTEVVPDKRFTQVVAGRAHTCAITTLGAVMCWGDSSLEQLGPGVTGRGPVTVRSVPTALGPFAAGADVTCALHADDRVRCWGQVVTTQRRKNDPDIVLDDFEACEQLREMPQSARTETGTNL